MPVSTCQTSILQAQHHAVTVQVSVYGRSRLSQDVFLGEVLIPLREVEEAGATGVAEVHKYILGRRSTKERVSGEIALACSWRVTPLDVVIMKVSLFILPCSTADSTGTLTSLFPVLGSKCSEPPFSSSLMGNSCASWFDLLTPACSISISDLHLPRAVILTSALMHDVIAACLQASLAT